MDRRRKSVIGTIWIVVVAVTWLVSSDFARAESWKAGVAREKITPQQFMWMAGYAARTRPAEGTHADLWVRTLVVEDPHGNRGVLISLDLIGIDRRLSQELCESLAQRFGLRRAQIAICCSHTHTGPVVGKCLEPLHYRQLDAQQRQLVDQYEQQLTKKIGNSVAVAIADLRASSLTWGTGVATFAVNRRNNPAGEVPKLRKESALQGPFDHDVPVLAVRDKQGKLRAVLFGYACHATTLSDYEWSGDYPGFAAAELELQNDGCTALFWAGCGADQNPLPRRTLELARAYGHQLADAVMAVLAGQMQRIAGPLKVTYCEVPLALDALPAEAELKEALKSSNKYLRARAEILLEQIARDGSLARTYPYPVGVWKIGSQVDLVLLGGEVVVDFAIRLKTELHGRRTWVAGYTNDVMAYIPSERVLREGGYEGEGAMVYYGLPAAWAPGVEQAIIDAVTK